MNPSKRKGTDFEVKVRDYLRSRGIEADRLAMGGTQDVGDIKAFRNCIIETKATKANDLASALNEARKEAQNAKVDHYVVVKHRRYKSAAEAFAILPLWVFVDLMLEVEKCAF